ncbi:MAG: ATP-binding protein [Candidatus Saccharimonadales bacterium]
MIISILFSFAIYQINFHEVNIRLENLENGLVSNQGFRTVIIKGNGNELRQIQSDQAALQMVMSLLYINIIILVAGGFGSYLLARRTLRPIEEAHEAQSRFTSDASHELRTPLTVIKAEIEVLLRDKKIDPDEARELMVSNLEEIDKLIRLSEMLLNLSRLDEDNLEKKTLDMPALLNETLKSFKASQKRFDVTTRKNATIYGNSAAISELITILIDNALKYSDLSSRISIRVFQKQRTIGCEIINNGPTIKEEVLPHLFERFYRGDTSRTNSTKNGYGLGLAIAKKIVDNHDGEIQVKSKDNKTVFTFYLPIHKTIDIETKPKNHNNSTDGKITTK